MTQVAEQKVKNNAEQNQKGSSTEGVACDSTPSGRLCNQQPDQDNLVLEC